MLADAPTAPPPPGLRFEVGTIESFVARAALDAAAGISIFSNAALHWVDDHERLIERLAAALAPSGQLAFQVPAQHDTLTHRLAEELTAVEPFASAFGGWRRSQPVLTPDAYARLLYRYGFTDPKVRLIVYPHVLASREDVVEWVKGTLLTEYKRHLPGDLFERFVDEYRGTAARAARGRAAVLLPVQADTLLGAAVRLRRTPHEMLKGTRDGILKKVQPVSIHGQVSWDVYFTDVEDPGRPDQRGARRPGGGDRPQPRAGRPHPGRVPGRRRDPRHPAGPDLVARGPSPC